MSADIDGLVRFACFAFLPRIGAASPGLRKMLAKVTRSGADCCSARTRNI
ncbi:hypothetical protein A8924_7142 [Saccharopolyspora erythraea NRRL 2338]|nr:hypothetical protein A8924_7142 [Saccharopolyspora erythraea NRRL 2338]